MKKKTQSLFLASIVASISVILLNSFTPSSCQGMVARENGTFQDVYTTDYYYDAIEQLAEDEILDKSKKDFNPKETLNRAEAVKILVLAKNWIESINIQTFEDVPMGTWFHPYVETALMYGVVSGYTHKPGYFGPEDPLTREQYIKMIVNSFELSLENRDTPTFQDVSQNRWSYSCIETAYSFGLVEGLSSKIFGPEHELSRGDAALILYRALYGLDVNGDDDDDNAVVSNYPFDGMNMYFGLLGVGNERSSKTTKKVEDFKPTWVSLQPHVIWMNIEHEFGVYDWTTLDAEIKTIQSYGLDATMLHVYPFNMDTPEMYAQFEAEIEEIQEEYNYSVNNAFLEWKRGRNGPESYDIVVDFTNQGSERTKRYVAFVKAATERYDGDGVDDMPGLEYAVRNHEFDREYAGGNEEKVNQYLASLKLLSPAIKESDPNAVIIGIGLHTKYGRIYAYLDGFLDDPDAGVWRFAKFSLEGPGQRYTKDQLASQFGIDKAGFERILDEGYDYYDVLDFHLYSEKETFIEGTIDYINHYVSRGEMRPTKPIWCAEGGGPFLNAPEDYDMSGDPYFGWMTVKKNAEWVVKSYVLPAAKGLERHHRPWGTEPKCKGNKEPYWKGPWDALAQITKCGVTNPAYYTYKIMLEKIKDFEIGNVTDLSIGDNRIFRFKVPNSYVYTAWNFNEEWSEINLSSIFGDSELKVTYIVTDLDDNDGPITNDDEIVNSSEVPLSVTPIFIEKIQ